MSDPEPPASDGQPEHPQHPEQRGSLSRLRTLFRLLRRPRGQSETIDALVATAADELGTPITPQERVLILDMLVKMRQARTHIAMVVDEFGGIDGLVTIEDVIEEIVGEIEDEHDVDAPPVLIVRPDGSIIADARIPIDAIEEQHGTRLRPPGEEDAVDTLGGLVFTLAGRVPKRGEIIAHPDGIEFEVLDADPRRVKRLRVRGLPPAANGSKGAASA